MSDAFLLLFMADGVAPPRGWLRLREGAVVARAGAGAIPSPAGDVENERIVLVVPGEDVVIHWIELPALAPAQAAAAARLMAGEVSAMPPERLHVALGAATGPSRAMALVSVERMAAWLVQAQALGLDPDRIVPEPLLLLPPEAGVVRWTRDGLHLLRGDTVALAAEPDLAALLVTEPPVPVDDATVEADLATALGRLPLDLRQGPFARRRRWRTDWALVRRLAALGGLMLLAVLAVQLVLILKYSLAADRLERELATVARAALPRVATITDPPQQLAGRLAELRGSGAGFSASAAVVFAAVRDTANVELAALSFDDQGVLRATATAANPADIAALARRIEAGGFAVESGDVRPGGGRQIAELTVRSR
ncbi:type II secretion system protein GspL [Sphingomonas solaris]|uniref:General secretion pathway protein GspL n=1 Tax=Alterirhizorhabdus solaris TaxID=2529389 RepID=A0A558R4C1_9SPHN|nr:type II secretion system protein GspL [Sphingomonas solaris]TVV74233.1 general secretion pathway protein GspL [Sphingomonas solaris]